MIGKDERGNGWVVKYRLDRNARDNQGRGMSDAPQDSGKRIRQGRGVVAIARYRAARYMQTCAGPGEPGGSGSGCRQRVQCRDPDIVGFAGERGDWNGIRTRVVGRTDERVFGRTTAVRAKGRAD